MRQINAKTLIPIGAVAVLLSAVAGLIPLGIGYGAERAAVAARLAQLERDGADRDRRMEALHVQLNAVERSLWRIEDKLGTLPAGGAHDP